MDSGMLALVIVLVVLGWMTGVVEFALVIVLVVLGGAALWAALFGVISWLASFYYFDHR